jgi:hypothetical protein
LYSDSGDLYAKLGNDQKALESYEKAVSLGQEIAKNRANARAILEEFPFIYIKMGIIYDKKGQTETAYNYFYQSRSNQAVANPTSVAGISNLKARAAVQAMADRIQIFPYDSEPYFGIACVLHRIGDTVRADEFEKEGRIHEEAKEANRAIVEDRLYLKNERGHEWSYAARQARIAVYQRENRPEYAAYWQQELTEKRQSNEEYDREHPDEVNQNLTPIPSRTRLILGGLLRVGAAAAGQNPQSDSNPVQTQPAATGGPNSPPIGSPSQPQRQICSEAECKRLNGDKCPVFVPPCGCGFVDPRDGKVYACYVR